MTSDKIITLTTDFGGSEIYAALVKSVIWRISKTAKIIDVTHSLNAFDILSANYFLYSLLNNFPKNTIHIVSVDSKNCDANKEIIIIKINEQYVICANNGIATLALQNFTNYSAYKLSLKNIAKLTKTDLCINFLARDAIAVAAGILANNRKKIFEITDKNKIEIIELKELKVIKRDNCVKCIVVHIDKFGNIITNYKIPKNDFFKIQHLKIKNLKISEKAETYNEIKKIAMLIGDSGLLEISASYKKASKLLKSNIGDSIEIFY
ncbi:MAG TPA: SAM-dependent chlorinase/fluorinase [bacterium]|nr:SAM-dependent chlorinase/fluorinase [bacterium]HPP87870.1 SAM-dependent chlorinase/fluorinase [bacterium]